ADLHAVLKIVEARVDFAVELGGRHDHFEFALEAFGEGLGHLHGQNSLSSLVSRNARSKSLRLVRAEGLEPPRLASLEPKSSASTNSATPAKAKSSPWWQRLRAVRLSKGKRLRARRDIARKRAGAIRASRGTSADRPAAACPAG